MCKLSINSLKYCKYLNLIRPGLFEGGSAWGRGGGVHAAHNSKTIYDNEMKFCGVVENRKVINLV